jgi:hypothetical protein
MARRCHSEEMDETDADTRTLQAGPRMTPVQQTPQIFTLLTALVVATALTFVVVMYRVLRGRRRAALQLLGRWAVAALIYVTMSLAYSALRPRRVVAVGQDWCFDDLCFGVDAVSRTNQPDGEHAMLTTQLHIYNAARSPEAARGFWAYVRDDHDTRYRPQPGSWQEAVVSRVQPRGFVRTTMTFEVPRNVRGLGFITGHGGVSPCALLPSVLEIGQGACLFGRPDVIRLE